MEEAASFGLTVEEASGEDVKVWPDNVPTLNVFVAMSTQWRVGYNGATGLDYAALPVVEDRVGIKADFDGLRAMEEAALAQMAENRR